MSQGPLCPNLSQKVQKEVSQMANRNLPIAMLLGGLSVNLNHLKKRKVVVMSEQHPCTGKILIRVTMSGSLQTLRE